jgi:nucleoside-diphosphate-sugar epimerase
VLEHFDAVTVVIAMKIFLTGGTGYTGGVVLDRFLAEGHEVFALTRPHHLPGLAARERLHWIGGDFSEPEIIADAAAQVDAAVHIGASHDAEMERLDATAIGAIADALADSGKVFVSTSATPVYGDTGPTPRDEHEPIEHPHPLRAWRARHDLEVVGLAERGIRGVVVRPSYIYGRAGGLLAGLILRAQSTGRALYIGDGLNLNSTIHVDALADLYLRAVIDEAATGIYNAASDEVIRNRDIAEIIAACFGPGIEAVSWPVAEAHLELGELAELSVVECVVSADKARRELRWSPTALSLAAELAAGSYRTQPLAPRHL